MLARLNKVVEMEGQFTGYQEASEKARTLAGAPRGLTLALSYNRLPNLVIVIRLRCVCISSILILGKSHSNLYGAAPPAEFVSARFFGHRVAA